MDETAIRQQIDDSTLPRVGDLRRISSPVGGATEDLGEIDGRDDHTVSDCLRYKLGARLIPKVGEQRRGVEYESQLLGVLSRGFCTSLGEQIIDHRPSGKIAEQAAALFGYGAIRAQSQRAVFLGAQEHVGAGLQVQLATYRRWQDHSSARPDGYLYISVGHTKNVPQ